MSQIRHCDLCNKEITNTNDWCDLFIPSRKISLTIRARDHKEGLNYYTIDICPACVVNLAKEYEKENKDAQAT